MSRRLRCRRVARLRAVARDTREHVAAIRRIRDEPLSDDMADLATSLEARKRVIDREEATVQAWFEQALASMQPGAARRPHASPAPPLYPRIVR
ncbi:MAG: hypothetical protein LC798_10680 [Chloroflexi bacterium]|nr:hypothetical protein [Chloroflexota bacterium]